MANQNIPEDIHQPTIKAKSGAKSVLMITADKTEDVEFFYPYYRFVEEGFKVDVATPKGKFEGKHGLGLKQTKKLDEVSADDYDLLYIPGGKAPEKLKDEDEAIELVKAFVIEGKPVAAVCHGPQLLAEANVISGKYIAAWPEVEEEVTDAGAWYQNKETVVDGQFITARWPADLPTHVAKTLEILKTMNGTKTAKRAA